MDYSDKIKQAIIKYEGLINEYYKQPVQRQFADAKAAILEGIRSDKEETDTDIEEEELQNLLI